MSGLVGNSGRHVLSCHGSYVENATFCESIKSFYTSVGTEQFTLTVLVPSPDHHEITTDPTKCEIIIIIEIIK